jgi:hypothetical protein
MGEIHNLQVLIAQQPQIARLDAATRNGLTNGAQIINVVGEQKRITKGKTVRKLEKSSRTEKENSKRKRKTTSERTIDIYT